MKTKLIVLYLVGRAYCYIYAVSKPVICKKELERITGRDLPNRVVIEYSLESFEGSVGIEVKTMFMVLLDRIAPCYILPGKRWLYNYASKLIHDLVLWTYGKPFSSGHIFKVYLKCYNLDIVDNPKCL